MMPHWFSYLWIGSICIVAAWCTYRYYLWARAMDKINADHFEFQKQGLWIEGISYFTAEFPEPEGVLGAPRFPVEEGQAA